MSHSANFLHHVEPPRVKRRHGTRRVLGSFALGCAALAVAYGAWLALAVGSLYAAASDGRAALERAQAAAERLDFDAAGEELGRARTRFAAAAAASGALRPLTALPGVGADVKAAMALAASGAEVCDALGEVMEAGADMVRLTGWSARDLEAALGGTEGALSFGDLPGDTKRAVLRRLAGSADALERVAARVAIAQDELARVPASDVSGPVLAALAPVREKLAALGRSLALASRLARVLPAFAGLDAPRTTLLLFLNNAELRPGGGFIGTYGTLTVRDADITALETHDVYAIDGPVEGKVAAVPPEPLRRWLGAQAWYFRDANWSPDFAASSAQALALFNGEERLAGRAPTAFDGVVGFTPTFVSDLLRITGPIQAGGQTFTAENMADELEYQVEIGFAKDGIPVAQRKEVLSELVDRMKEALYALPRARWGEVAAAFDRAVAGKQLMLYAADPRAQKAVEAAGWAAAMHAPAWGDALMAVDANLASLKSDPAVKRTVRYDLSRNSSGAYVGRVTLRYEHQGRFDWKTTRYRTYARVFVPEGSKLVRVTGALQDDALRDPRGTPGTADVGAEGGFATFGAFTAVEPGRTGELAFEFLLAPQVAEAVRSGAYRLRALKQPGAADNGLTLHLDFDKNLTSASVPEDRSKWGDDTYDVQVALDRDRTFEVGL